MGYLRRLVEGLGGKLVERKVTGPIDSLEADVLVNCAGIGNAVEEEGLESDALMRPVRGQIVHCENRANITEAITIGAGDESCYVIPRGDVVVYGGTSDDNQWDLTVNQGTGKPIRADPIRSDPSPSPRRSRVDRIDRQQLSIRFP